MAHTALTSIRTYADLTKPRLLPMVLFTGLPVLGMAAGGWPGIGFAVLALLGIAFAAASANTLNAYIERDRDALMERTRRAARRLVAEGRLEITQRGQVVDPTQARGAIRLRLRRG